MRPTHRRPSPTWLIDEPCTDIDLGVIKSGKEAQVSLIERTYESASAPVVFARKQYLPREVKSKGQLEASGMQRVSTFVNDVHYREGRQFRKTRDRRAIENMTTYGKHLLQDRWTGHEHEVMTRLWEAGMNVPYPISYGEDVFDLEYIGDDAQAAPQLQAARLDGTELQRAFDQLRDGLHVMCSQGFAHGDLSAYNLLWWDDTLWFIDFPQAIEIAANLSGFDFLHRDIVNVCTWFNRKGLAIDADELFAELIAVVR
jgi:RIO kinase 1